MTIKLGISTPVQGATDAFWATQSALGAEVVVLLPSASLNDAQRLTAAKNDIVLIVRVETIDQNESAAQYIERIRGRVTPFYQAGFPLIYFQLGNEPDIAGYDVPQPYDPAAWRAKAAEMVAAFRGAFPGAALISTPFSVERTAEATPDYLALFDAANAHSYWQVASDISNPVFGRSYSQLRPSNQPFYVTEVNNSAGTNVDELAAWYAQAEADGVTGGVLFIADGQGQWATFNVTADQAAALAQRVRAVPAPKPAVQPLWMEPRASVADRMEALKSYILHYAAQFGVPASDIAAFIEEESGGYLPAQNPDGGTGLFQLTPPWHVFDQQRMLTDVDYNFQLGVAFIKQCLASGGDLAGAAGTYGPHHADGSPDAGYVNTILALQQKYAYLDPLPPPAPAPTPPAPVAPVLPLPSPDPSNPAPLPSNYPAPADPVVAIEEKVGEEAMRHVGETEMGPGQPLDDGNGYVHVMADWCEAGAETVAAIVTGERIRFPSAYAHAMALKAAGHLDPDPTTAKAGEFDFWGPYSDGFGHITIRGTDGKTYGTNVVPNGWMGWPVDHYPSYLGHATPEAVVDVAKNMPPGNEPDMDNPFGRVDPTGRYRSFHLLAAQYGGFVPMIGNGIKDKFDVDGPQLGILRYGYPIPVKVNGAYANESDVLLKSGHTLTVQWFERARLEWHPDVDQVMIGRIGAETLQFWIEQGQQIPTCVASTDNVAPQFAQFYETHGGLGQFGYPLTPLTALPGSTYQSQVFERCVMELHPENTEWPVQLRLLGREWQDAVAAGVAAPHISE